LRCFLFLYHVRPRYVSFTVPGRYQIQEAKQGSCRVLFQNLPEADNPPESLVRDDLADDLGDERADNGHHPRRALDQARHDVRGRVPDFHWFGISHHSSPRKTRWMSDWKRASVSSDGPVDFSVN